jgi:hypothetical protein
MLSIVPSIHSLDQLCLVDFLGSEHASPVVEALAFLSPLAHSLVLMSFTRMVHLPFWSMPFLVTLGWAFS